MIYYSEIWIISHRLITKNLALYLKKYADFQEIGYYETLAYRWGKETNWFFRTFKQLMEVQTKCLGFNIRTNIAKEKIGKLEERSESIIQITESDN